MTGARIPLVDLGVQHAEVASEIDAGLARVIASRRFVGGPEVEEFERRYASFVGVAHCVGVANGTDALELALRALDVGSGDEVILPANTFIATALAVQRCGATPVLVDCDPDHHLMDIRAAARRIGPRTRAIIPVHLYGQMAPLEQIAPLAERSRVAVVEDAAQAHGARRHGQAAGAVGIAAATSFYPGKNLGAYGDAGALLTSDDRIAQRVRRLRNFGGDRRHEHLEAGFNSRLDALQAAVLNAKLDRLPAWNEARRAAAARYDALLAGLEQVGRPRSLPGNEHVWHLYVVRVPRRDRVLARLVESGVEASIHYPAPLHLTGTFASLGHRRGDFPVSERLADEILSLPMFPGITADQQQRVVSALAEALGEDTP